MYHIPIRLAPVMNNKIIKLSYDFLWRTKFIDTIKLWLLLINQLLDDS